MEYKYFILHIRGRVCLVALAPPSFLCFFLTIVHREAHAVDIGNIRNRSLYVKFASRIFPFLCLQMCNEWAIDTPCPAGGRDFCRSLHILDSRGNSVLASKLFFPVFPQYYHAERERERETSTHLQLIFPLRFS